MVHTYVDVSVSWLMRACTGLLGGPHSPAALSLLAVMVLLLLRPLLPPRLSAILSRCWLCTGSQVALLAAGQGATCCWPLHRVISTTQASAHKNDSPRQLIWHLQVNSALQEFGALVP